MQGDGGDRTTLVGQRQERATSIPPKKYRKGGKKGNTSIINYENGEDVQKAKTSSSNFDQKPVFTRRPVVMFLKPLLKLNYGFSMSL